MATKTIINVSTGEVSEVPLTPEEEAEAARSAAETQARQATAAFGQAEDAERLALVADRAQTDPAFAALADLTLARKG